MIVYVKLYLRHCVTGTVTDAAIWTTHTCAVGTLHSVVAIDLVTVKSSSIHCLRYHENLLVH